MNQPEFIKNGHRWTEAELRELIGMWLSDEPTEKIAAHFGVKTRSVSKLVGRLRRDGIPLAKRKLGHIAGRHNKPWTQEEVEYLIRRRNDRVNASQIGEELDRTHNAVSAMISNLRSLGVNVRLIGQGPRRLWNAESLRAAIVGRGLRAVTDETEEAA